MSDVQPRLTAKDDRTILKNPSNETWYHPYVRYGTLPEGVVNFIGEIVFGPGTETAEHLHSNEAEVWCLTSGRLVNIIDGVEYDMSPGDVCHQPLGSRHATRNDGSEDAVVHAVVVRDPNIPSGLPESMKTARMALFGHE